MLNFNALREMVKGMASTVCTLVKKDTDGYVEGKQTYRKVSTGEIFNTDGFLMPSGSDSEYYPIDKGLKDTDRAKFETLKLAVSLRSVENRLAKQGDKAIQLLNSMVDIIANPLNPCDPHWIEVYLGILGKIAQAMQSAGEANQRRFENWEATSHSATSTQSATSWRPC